MLKRAIILSNVGRNSYLRRQKVDSTVHNSQFLPFQFLQANICSRVLQKRQARWTCNFSLLAIGAGKTPNEAPFEGRRKLQPHWNINKIRGCCVWHKRRFCSFFVGSASLQLFPLKSLLRLPSSRCRSRCFDSVSSEKLFLKTAGNRHTDRHNNSKPVPVCTLL